MSDKLIEQQISEINRKLDLLLDDASIQRQNREAVNDLIDDAAVIGKDVFKNMVVQLDDAGIELDGEAIRDIGFRFIRNINNMGIVLEVLESFTDLAKDVTPIIKQIGLDGVQKFNDFEQKGYFEVLNQVGKTIDTVISRYNKEDLQRLSENLIPVIDTLVNIADPKLLNKINSASTALKAINPEDIEEYSVWRLMKQLNKPEVRKSIGFIMVFLQNISKTEINSNN
jgi:uncharacterized protein YjgD (DUF1641 family)